MPEECRTEVFFLPAASHVEKEGTFTQTQRLLQWREKAVEPPGDCRSELWFFYHLGRLVRERLAGSAERARPADPRPDLGLPDARRATTSPSAEAVLREINGYDVATGRPLSTFTELKDDGSTLGGCWIYTGVFADGVNQAARRKPGTEQAWVAPEWGWAWPANRRILYNRASADPHGQAVERAQGATSGGTKPGDAGEWTGHDVPDFEKTKPPSYRPPEDATASRRSPATTRSSCRATGRAGSTRPPGLLDGPLPTHYEPVESPFRNPLYGQQANPTRKEYGTAATTG